MATGPICVGGDADRAEGCSSKELNTGEFLPNDPCCLGTHSLKPFEPVSHCLELGDGHDAVLPQPLPGMAGKTEPCDGAADTVQ